MGSSEGPKRPQPPYSFFTTTVRHEALPAASLATTVIVFVPSYKEIGEVRHCVVPDAPPEVPMELDQVTETTPTLSLATPLNSTEPRDVKNVVEVGD
jgi:hypothetical protein